MLLLRCTQKLQTKLGLKKKDLEQDIPDNLSPIAQWHAHLFWVFRIPNIIFVNDESLFSLVVLDINKERRQNLLGLFTKTLSTAMRLEGFSRDVIEHVTNSFTEIKYANTNNRSVLGTMNEFALQYDYDIANRGGAYDCDIADIIYKANQMPHVKRDDFSDRMFRKMIKWACKNFCVNGVISLRRKPHEHKASICRAD